MPVWKASFLVLLAFPGIALVDAALDVPEPEERLLTPEQLLKFHAKMDADANGKLSLEEVLKFAHDNGKSAVAIDGKAIMETLDSDNNGKISLDELELGLAAYFYPKLHEDVLQMVTQRKLEGKDHDKDGLLTIDEFWNDSDSEVPEVNLSGPPHSEDELHLFQKLDEDGSGKINMKELLVWESWHINFAGAIENFMQLADTDSDQHVTIEELQAATEKEETKYKIMEMAQHHEF